MKKKRTLLAIFALILVVFIGATIAYFQSSASFDNIFNTGTYKVVTTESFESPDNWKPGEEIPKTITTKNEGTIDAAVRVSYTEKWEDSEGNDITSQVASGTAIINLDNTSEWTKEGNYYYYNYILKPNETTSSFMKSVTLNSNIGNDVTCTASQDGLTKTCESSNPALGAKYTLTITKETVQADKYKDVWNTNVEIGEKPLVQIMNSERDKDNLQVGDEICINGDTKECFNFIGYDGDNIKLLSKYNLNVGNNIQPGVEGVQNSLAVGYNEDESTMVNDYWPATVDFSGTNYWYNGDTSSVDPTDGNKLKPEYGTSFPADVYDTDYNEATGNNYSVVYYVENYKNTLERYGATVIDARLLTYSEATDSSIGCGQTTSRRCPTTGFITNTSFWLGSVGTYTALWIVNSSGGFTTVRFNANYVSSSSGVGATSGTNASYRYGVRPVIVISKDSVF